MIWLRYSVYKLAFFTGVQKNEN